MKKVIYIITIITILITTFSCQEVVNVDLETAQERLVIEALINWEKGTLGNEQIIKLSKTSSFYNNQFLFVTGASVKLTNKTTLQEFVFIDNNDGLYSNTSFVPVLHNIYTLEINYNGEIYIAEETLLPAPDITGVTQSIENGFSQEEPEVNVSFQDFIGQEDYYRIAISHYRPSTNEVVEDIKATYDSSFEEDNILSIWYENDNLEIDDEISISIYKITYPFYNFLEVLAQQANAGIGPFASPPVNVKGNCVNTTKETNYPYGYFSINEINTIVHTFE